MLLGEAYAKAKKWDEARKAYEQAIELKGGRYAPATLAIGTLLRRQRDYETAKKILAKAVEEFIDPTGKAKATLELARIARVEGNDGEALKLLERALRLDPSLPDTYYLLGTQLAGDRRNRSKAKKFLQVYLERAPTGPLADRARRLMSRL